MGANSTQGIAVLLFVLAFTFLGGAMFTGGNVLLILLFLVSLGASIWQFLRCKPWEQMER